MTTIAATATDITRNTNASAHSALIEAGGRELDWEVNRLRSNLVALPLGDQHLIFSGLCGPSTSRVATTLCKDTAWLRRTLALKGIPTPKTLKLPVQARDTARNFVADQSEPTYAWWQDHPELGAQMTASNFSAQWKQFLASQPDEESNVILQPVVDGTPIDVTVAFGAVVGTGDDESAQAQQIALQSVAVLPGAEAADVTLTKLADGSIVVDRVDVRLTKWGELPYPEGVDGVILAILKGERASVRQMPPATSESSPSPS